MNTWIKKLIQPIALENWIAEFVLLIPRLVCGFLLTLDFGSSKFGLPWSPPEKNLRLMEVAFWFPHDVAEYGGVFAHFPDFLAWMGAFSEAVGGVFIILGLFTRPFAFLIACTMSVAVFMQQWHAGIWNMLPALGFLWASLYWTVLGSGRLGLDYYLPSLLRKLLSRAWGKPVLWMVGVSTIGFLLIHGGLQKTHKQTLIITAKSEDGTPNVGMSLRGSDYPLSWSQDYEMQPVIEDSLFTAKIEINTGYNYTELKLVRNGEFEFKDQDNRVIRFDEDRTTEVNLIYNKTSKPQ